VSASHIIHSKVGRLRRLSKVHHSHSHSRRNSTTSILNLVPQKQVTDFQSKREEEQVSKSFCGLFFVNREIESSFLRFYYGRNLVRFRLVIIFVSLFWIFFLYGDITKDIKKEREWAYYTNIVLRMVPLVVSFFSFIILLLPNVFRRDWAVEIIAGVTVSSFSTCICAMAAFAHVSPNYINYPIGSMLVLIVVYTLPRLRMLTMGVNAALSLLTYVVAHVAANASHFYDDTARIFIFILAIGFTHIVGMSQAYWVEAFFRRVFTLQQEIHFRKKSVMSEKDVTQKLLQNILPAELVPRVQAAPQERFVQKYPSMSAIQSDLKNFTKMSGTISASALVDMLNAQFSAFDAIGKANNIQRSKTVGDAWLGYGVDGNHQQNAFRAGLYMIHALKELNATHGWEFDIRIGVATGSGLLVVFGVNYLTFDCYGHAVSDASTLESNGEANQVHIDELIYNSLDPMLKSVLNFEPVTERQVIPDQTTYLVDIPPNLNEVMASVFPDQEERYSGRENDISARSDDGDSARHKRRRKLSTNSDGSGHQKGTALTVATRESVYQLHNSSSTTSSSLDTSQKSLYVPGGASSANSSRTPPTTPPSARSSDSTPTTTHASSSIFAQSSTQAAFSANSSAVARPHCETTVLKTHYEAYRKHTNNRFVGLQKLPALDEKAQDESSASLLADFKGAYSFNPLCLFFYNVHTHIQFMKDSYINMTGVVGSFLFLVVLIEIFITCGILAMFAEEAGSSTLIVYYIITILSMLMAVIYILPCVSRFIVMGSLFTCIAILSSATFIPLLFALPVNVVNEFLPAVSFWFILIVSLSTLIPVLGQLLIMITVLLFNAIFLLLTPQYRDLNAMAVVSVCAAMQMISSYGLARSIAKAFVLRKQAKYALVRVKRERDINNSLLQSCLPRHVLERIKKNPSTKIHDSESGAILFAEVLGFNDKMNSHPVETVQLINDIFSLFDSIIDRRNCVKIKSIGSIYIAVAIGKRPTVECDRMAKCGMFMLKAMQEILTSHQYALDTSDMGLRVGCNYGNFTAAIVGHSKLLYDVWADSINQTSRFCTSAKKDEIRCSEVFYHALRDLNYDFECLGPIFLKGKGEKVLYKILVDGVVTPSTPGGSARDELTKSRSESTIFPTHTPSTAMQRVTQNMGIKRAISNNSVPNSSGTSARGSPRDGAASGNASARDGVVSVSPKSTSARSVMSHAASSSRRDDPFSRYKVEALAMQDNLRVIDGGGDVDVQSK